jgi:hypothetical protein
MGNSLQTNRDSWFSKEEMIYGWHSMSKGCNIYDKDSRSIDEGE